MFTSILISKKNTNFLCSSQNLFKYKLNINPVNEKYSFNNCFRTLIKNRMTRILFYINEVMVLQSFESKTTQTFCYFNFYVTKM